MKRRMFLAASAAALVLAPLSARAASPADAQQFINNLGDTAISSLTGSGLSSDEREKRFQGLLESHFDLPGICKFVLARYWNSATDAQKADFSRLFEKLLVQSYAKTFAEYAGQRFQVSGGTTNDDGSLTVNSHIDQ